MTPAEAKAALRHFKHFIGARGWRQTRDGARFNEFVPPRELQLPETFSITVPIEDDAIDLPEFVSHLTTLLADIYSISIEQLLPVISVADAVMSMTIKDLYTEDGSIELARFESLLLELKNLIVHTTAFVADEDIVVDHVSPEAITFVNNCRFLQTSRGSFVASVQLPADEIIRNTSLFDKEPVLSSKVTERLTNVLAFVSNQVLSGDQNLFSEEHVRSHSQLINLTVLENVQGLFSHAGDTTLSFSFLAIDSSQTVTTGLLSDAKVEVLGEYVKYIRKLVTEELTINVEGKIVELRSRNPQGNRNHIVVQADYEQRPTFFAVTLSNELYRVAVQAHRSSRRVRLMGRARRLKTQIKISELDSFEPV